MALTRKEKLLKAMLEDNAAGCLGGVTREERMLAGVAKKACDNDALEGGGGGGSGGGAPEMFIITKICDERIGYGNEGYATFSANMPFEKLAALWKAGTPPMHAVRQCDLHEDTGECYRTRFTVSDLGEAQYDLAHGDYPDSVSFTAGMLYRYDANGLIEELDQ